MEESNMVVVKSEDKDLYTTSDLCKVLGNVTKATVTYQMRAMGLTPVVPAVSGPKGHEALWDINAYNAAKVHLEEEEAKRIGLIEKHVNALTTEEQGFVVTKNIQALQDRHDEEAMREKAFAAAAIVQSLMADAAFYRNEYSQALKDSEEYRKQLDISTSMCTVETYAINKRIPCTRAKAGSITRKLHQAGYQDEGKIPSKYDNNLPATVWKMEILDAAYLDGLFE